MLSLGLALHQLCSACGMALQSECGENTDKGACPLCHRALDEAARVKVRAWKVAENRCLTCAVKMTPAQEGGESLPTMDCGGDCWGCVGAAEAGI